MAAQIKLLLEIPEKIWSSMEASQYLHATQLYLLCCHLHNLLRLDCSGSRYSPVLSRFPILIRQVAAASHFRYVDPAKRSALGTAILHHYRFMERVFYPDRPRSFFPRCKKSPVALFPHLPRSTILHESKMLLKCHAVSDQAVAEALCSIMLLEESSPRQALADFLLARKAAIQKLLDQSQRGGFGFFPKYSP